MACTWDESQYFSLSLLVIFVLQLSWISANISQRLTYCKTRGPWTTSLTWENTGEEDLNFVNIFSLFRNYLPLGEGWIRITQGCFVPSLDEISTVVLEKQIFLNCVNVFLLFPNHLPLEKGMAFHWNKLESPFTQEYFVPSMVETGPVPLEKILSLMYFRYLVIVCAWKRTGPFIWTNLNLLHPRMLCTKFGSGVKCFKMLLMNICYIVIISP